GLAVLLRLGHVGEYRFRAVGTDRVRGAVRDIDRVECYLGHGEPFVVEADSPAPGTEPHELAGLVPRDDSGDDLVVKHGLILSLRSCESRRTRRADPARPFHC